jgi:hypothetical protein
MSRLVASLVIAAALAQSSAAPGEMLTCTDWQGIRTCQDGHGYTSHETQWQDRAYGSDNEGTRWTTSRWRDTTITTVTPPSERR